MTDWFVSKLLDEPKVKVTIESSNLPALERESKERRPDVVVNVNDMTYLDLEPQSSTDVRKAMKNFGYSSTIFNGLTKRGKEFCPENRVIQIDFSLGIKAQYDDVEVMLVQSPNGVVYLQNFVIEVYNLDKIKKYWYHEDAEKIREFAHIIMLVLGEEDLEKLVEYAHPKDREFIEKFRKDVLKMQDDSLIETWLTTEELEEIERNTVISEAKREGHASGLAEGISQGKTESEEETVRKMLRDKLEPSVIKKYVNLTLDRINQIKLTML